MKKIDDPTVKPGDTIDANGLPVYVASDEEIEKSVNEDDLTIVCMPVELGGTVVPGSTVGRCGMCGKDVWVSPATRESVPVGAPIRCILCVKELIEAAGPPQKVVSTKHQTKEIQKGLKEDPWGEL